jgi:uracil-DNA glycosylase family 4
MSWQNKIREPDCELCPLHEGAEHVCLMGSGPKHADIMIVGEAPGAREDESHKAFVGPSGVLLTELLTEAGLKRSDCYITNVAKCRPPGNRTPTKVEIRTCVDEYLESEIDRIHPRYILTLGNSALQGLTGKSGIKKHRGSVFRYGDAQLLATLHPAAALRNPYLRPELRADFQRLGRMVRKEKEGTPTKLRIIKRKSQLDALIKLLMHEPVIAWDLETYAFDNGIRLKGKQVTSGLQEWREESRIVCVSVAWEEGETAVIPIHHKSSPWKDPEATLQKLKPVFERQDCKYIAQNGKFDCRYLASRKIYNPLTFDTMLAAHMLDENRSKGLKPLAEVLLGVDAWGIGEDVKDAYNTPLRRLCTYAAKDADFTLRLYYKFRAQLKEEPRTARIFKLLMMPASDMFVKVERRGIWVDMQRVDERLEKAQGVVKKLKRMMYKHMPEEKRPQKPDLDKRQTKKYLKEIAGLKGGAWSTDESVLLQLAREHEAVRIMLKYRKWSKYLDTYLLPLKYKHTDSTGRTHPTYKLFGTVTGRLSCSDPNLQQIPRNPFLRAVIGAPPGWKFIEADYSQIELRIAAMLAHDTNLLRVFHEGRDPHMEMAIEISGLPESKITSEIRKQAKPVNFGYLYGMGWEKFITYARDNYEVEFSEQQAKAVRDLFFRRWSRLKAWHERQRRIVRNHGRVQSPIGRIRHLPDVYSQDKEVRAEAERQAINSPVQSFASDLMLVSALQLNNRLDPARCFIVGSIHDALGFQVQEEHVEESVDTIRRVMLKPPVSRLFGARLTVPIDVEIKVGQHWGEGTVV